LHFTLPAESTRHAAVKLGIDHSLFSRLLDSMKKRNLHASRLGGGAVGGGVVCGLLKIATPQICTAIAGLGSAAGFLIEATDKWGGAEVLFLLGTGGSGHSWACSRRLRLSRC
jgi:hypothetical protein